MILLYNLHTRVHHELVTLRKCYWLETEKDLLPVLASLLQSNRHFEMNEIALYDNEGRFIRRLVPWETGISNT